MEEPFRLLVESIQDYGVFMLDPEGRIATWNAGAERIKGYRASEIIGQHFSKFYPPEDIAARKPERELEQAIAEGRITDEGWRLRKDGSRFWAFVVITALRDSTGKLVGFGKVTRDLTERKEAEEQLRTSEEQFRMLVDGVEEYAIYMLDPTGCVATWNSGAQKIKQYSANQIIGRNFSCFFTPEDIAAGKPMNNLRQAIEHGHYREQGRRVRKDGSIFEADVVVTALRDSSGELRGFSKVTRDITDQLHARDLQAAKMAAEESSKAKDDFIAALSHELRTPLTPALAAASYLAGRSDELPPEFSEDLETIRRNVQLEARLIDDLLDLTRISRGKVHLHLEDVDAHAVIHEALATTQTEIARKQIGISTHLHAPSHFISADAIRLQQVFWNLINNAVKFTPERGRVEIRTTNNADEEFVFEIIDNGIGIDPDQHASLFTAFEQAKGFSARQFGGLGLGLAICKNLVDLHHGKIAAESAGPGKGATFRVTLPAFSTAAHATTSRGDRGGKIGRRLRILLVEDHADTRRILARLLQRCGHEITTAESVHSAVKMLDSRCFDAVLSDIGLPDGTGYEVMTHAKREQPVKGIALTGFGMDEDIRRSHKAGFDFHLTKPVDFAELRGVLGEIESPA